MLCLFGRSLIWIQYSQYLQFVPSRHLTQINTLRYIYFNYYDKFLHLDFKNVGFRLILYWSWFLKWTKCDTELSLRSPTLMHTESPGIITVNYFYNFKLTHSEWQCIRTWSKCQNETNIEPERVNIQSPLNNYSFILLPVCRKNHNIKTNCNRYSFALTTNKAWCSICKMKSWTNELDQCLGNFLSCNSTIMTTHLYSSYSVTQWNANGNCQCQLN